MIGIIGAMDEEVAILKESMEVQDTLERAGMTFVKGIMSGKEVVVVRSGIGKVNMGICAQILIDCFGVDTLINTGVAGSLDADINIGDVMCFVQLRIAKVNPILLLSTCSTSVYDEKQHAFAEKMGSYEIEAGSSSRDIRLRREREHFLSHPGR